MIHLTVLEIDLEEEIINETEPASNSRSKDVVVAIEIISRS